MILRLRIRPRAITFQSLHASDYVLGFLPLIALAFAIHACSRRFTDARAAIAIGAVWWGSGVVAATEALSAAEVLTRTNLGLFWTVFAVGAFAVGRKVQSRTGDREHQPKSLSIPADWISRACLVLIICFLLATLVLAWASAASSADAMTYHLPRIEHWIQNKSVLPYPTNIQRELWPDPGAEYVVLQFNLLSGTDRAATLVQWGAYAMSIMLASLIARELGASPRAQWLAAFLTATIPGAVSQATGSQVELLFAVWLAISVWLGLNTLLRRKRLPVPETVAFGASIGLAILTKATAYLFLAPFLLWFIIGTIRSTGGAAIKRWVMAAAVSLTIFAPHSYQNVVVYGHVFGQPDTYGVVNSSFFVAGTLSNIVRNLSLHFGTSFAQVNSNAEQAVIAIDRTLGISPDDPRTTFPHERYRFNPRQSAEQTAGSPIHVLLSIGVLVYFVVRRRKYSYALIYSGCAAAGFLLFCFYLRWQPWHARLHLPLLILFSPAIALALDAARRTFVAWGASALAFATALPPVLRNPPRPLIGAGIVFSIPRQQQYFAEYPDLYPGYSSAANQLAAMQCSNIGLWITGDGIEYPLWKLLQAKLHHPVRIQHISVDNPSAFLSRIPSSSRFTPCALVLVNSEGRYKPLDLPAGYSFRWKSDNVLIYTPVDAD